MGKPKRSDIPFIVEKDIEISNTSEIADCFNNFFASVASSIDSTKPPGKYDPLIDVKCNLPDSFFFLVQFQLQK